jgi:hypothetical protein
MDHYGAEAPYLQNGYLLQQFACLLWADFVAEVGDDRCVAPAANVFK